MEDDDDDDNAELTDEDWVRRTNWYFDEPSGPFKHRLLQALNLDPQDLVRSQRLWEAAIVGIGEHRMLSDAEHDVLPPAQERL